MLQAMRRLPLMYCVAAATAFSQEHPQFHNEFQADPVEYYGARFLTGILILGCALVLFSLLRHRGRIAGTASIVLLVAGIVVLPAASMLFGTLLVFERAERVEFCASCHLTMKGYVDDLTNHESTSLASIHFKNRYIPSNQCYECHTSYGMFGTVEAKMAGMIDVYKYYTHTYTFPIEMRSPYPNTDCLKCHADAEKWKAQESHTEFRESIFSGETSCMQCHSGEKPPVHLAKWKELHQDFLESIQAGDLACSGCHEKLGTPAHIVANPGGAE
jgi:nitrate/TMAO reductase-like tetraheme cytochrome c subunit